MNENDKMIPVSSTINASFAIAEEVIAQIGEDNAVEFAVRNMKERLVDELAPFFFYQSYEDRTRFQRIFKGRVFLLRVGEWEDDPDYDNVGIKWKRCSVCLECADEDSAGSMMTTPFCSRCGAFLGGDYR